MNRSITAAHALDARTPTDPTEYDSDIVHPRLTRTGHCVTCGRHATEPCEFPYEASELDWDNDITDYGSLRTISLGADARVVVLGGGSC